MARYIQGSQDTYIFERLEIINLLLSEYSDDDIVIQFLREKLKELSNQKLAELFHEAAKGGTWELDDFVDREEKEEFEGYDPKIEVVNSFPRKKSKKK